MLGEDPHHGALHGSAVVEQFGRNSLNGFAMVEKQRLSRSAWRTSHAGQLIHRGIADLAVDRFAVVQHGESECQPFVVIPYNAAARQRHPKPPLASSPSVLRAVVCREGGGLKPILSRRDRGARDRSTQPSPAFPPAPSRGLIPTPCPPCRPPRHSPTPR